jgi:hypothetical protein
VAALQDAGQLRPRQLSVLTFAALGWRLLTAQEAHDAIAAHKTVSRVGAPGFQSVSRVFVSARAVPLDNTVYTSNPNIFRLCVSFKSECGAHQGFLPITVPQCIVVYNHCRSS